MIFSIGKTIIMIIGKRVHVLKYEFFDGDHIWGRNNKYFSYYLNSKFYTVDVSLRKCKLWAYEAVLFKDYNNLNRSACGCIK